MRVPTNPGAVDVLGDLVESQNGAQPVDAGLVATKANLKQASTASKTPQIMLSVSQPVVP